MFRITMPSGVEVTPLPLALVDLTEPGFDWDRHLHEVRARIAAAADGFRDQQARLGPRQTVGQDATVIPLTWVDSSPWAATG